MLTNYVKRILSFALALIMVLGLMPLQVMGAGEPHDHSSGTCEIVEQLHELAEEIVQLCGLRADMTDDEMLDAVFVLSDEDVEKVLADFEIGEKLARNLTEDEEAHLAEDEHTKLALRLYELLQSFDEPALYKLANNTVIMGKVTASASGDVNDQGTSFADGKLTVTAKGKEEKEGCDNVPKQGNATITITNGYSRPITLKFSADVERGTAITGTKSVPMNAGESIVYQLVTSDSGPDASAVLTMSGFEVTGKVTFGAVQGEGSYTVSVGETTETITTEKVERADDAFGTEYKLAATIPEGYEFQGWYDENGNCLSTSTEYSFEKEGHITVSAKFAKGNVKVEFAAPENGTYSVGEETVTEAGLVKDGDFNAKYALNAEANTDEGYFFFGWYDVTNGKYVGHSASFEYVATDDVVLKPVFMKPDGLAQFGVGSETFYNLNAADAAATAGSTKTIVLLNSGRMPVADYTVSKGNTLLIPYNAEHTLKTTTPEYADGDPYYPTAFRTLTVSEGVNLSIKGDMSVGAKILAINGSELGGGVPVGTYGYVLMEKNSNITVESDAGLYCYGYINVANPYYSQSEVPELGSVTIKSGAVVYETFQLEDFRGGSQLDKMVPTEGGGLGGIIGGITGNASEANKRVFPMNAYTVQNVMVPMTLEAGATEYGFACMTVLGGTTAGTELMYIGRANAFFNMTGGKVTKRYDHARDRLDITIDSTENSTAEVAVNGITMKLSSYKLNSSDYILPIDGNMTIRVNSGTLNLNQDVLVQPGCEVYISENAACNMSSTASLFLFDLDQWNLTDGQGYVGAGSMAIRPTYFVPPVGDIPRLYTRTKADLKDVEFVVAGEVYASGYVYTTGTATTGGASVTGVDGAKVTLRHAGKSDQVLYELIQTGTPEKYPSIPITTGKLKNADGSYTDPSKVNPNYGSVYTYNGETGKWEFVCGKNGTESGCALPTEKYACKDTACTLCGEVASYATTGHTISEKATCTTADYCSVCKEYVGNPNGHNKNATPFDGKPVANCGSTETGYKAYYQCPDCGVYFEDKDCTVEIGKSEDVLQAWKDAGGNGHIAIPAHTHGEPQAIEEGRVEPTCIAEGSYVEVSYCTVCSKESKRETKPIAKIPHSYDEGSVTKQPTCAVVGVKTFKCKTAGCTESYTEDIATIPHTSNNETVDCTTAETCSVCHGVITPALGHTPGEAQEENKTPDGFYDLVTYCTVCNAEISRVNIAPDGSSHQIEWKDAVPVTCTTDGLTKGAICVDENCKDCAEKGKYEIKQEVIPATGHNIVVSEENFQWDYENRKCTASAVCGNCGNVSVTVDITSTTEAPTCEADGTITYSADFTGTDVKEFGTRSKTEKNGDKLNHDWANGQVAFTYYKGEEVCGSYVGADKCVATHTCKNNTMNSCVITEEAVVVADVTDPGCETDGYTVYTVDFKTNVSYFLDVNQKVVDEGSATGHTWKVLAGTEDWSIANENALSFKADIQCDNCQAKQYDVPASVESKVTVAATCEDKGVIAYVATFAPELNLVAQSTTKDIDALGHDWNTPTYTFWKGEEELLTLVGADKCVATRTCKNADHPETKEAVVTSESNATCEEKGITTYTATFDAPFTTRTDYAEAELLPHDVEEVGGTPATCQDVGTAAHFKCKVCEGLFLTQYAADNNNPVDEDDLVLPTADHEFINYVYNNDASCTKAGTMTAKCIYHSYGCTETHTKDDPDHPKLAHVYTTYELSLAATCEHNAKEKASCDYGCGTMDEREIPETQLDHDYQNTADSYDATCTETGWERKMCVNGCEDSPAGKTIPALGHDYTQEGGKVVTDPTCTAKGFTTYDCSRCDETHTGDYVDALGHKPVKVEAKASTCEKAGVHGNNEYYTCSRCPGVFKDEACTVATTVEAETLEFVAHSYTAYTYDGNATCLNDGTMTAECDYNCGEKNTVADPEHKATGHNYNEGVITTAPTCTEKGVKTFTCKNTWCDKDVTHTNTEDVDALGHNLVEHAATDSTCDVAGHVAYYECAENPLARTAGGRSYCGNYFAKETDTAAAATPIAQKGEEETVLKTWLAKPASENGGAKELRSCKDDNKDHQCDYDDCDKAVGEHIDGDFNHKCDFYGFDCALGTIGDHADVITDTDHLCDYCGLTYGGHEFVNGVCNCTYVQDLNVTITIKAKNQDDHTLADETIKYKNGGQNFTKTLDLEDMFGASCYTIQDLSAKVNGEAVESSKQGNTLTISSDLLTGDVEIIVNAYQNHQTDAQHTTVTTIPATCDEPGEKKTVLTCINCGTDYSTDTQVIDALGHDYDPKYTEPTFDADGFTTYTCKNDKTHTYTEQDEGTKLIAVAQFNGIKYQKLEDAIAAATARQRGELELFGKVVVEGTQVWDLGRVELYIDDVQDENGEDIYGLVVKGDLTIKSGTYLAEGFYGIGVNSVGKLTIDGGKFEVLAANDYLIGTWGETVINGGEFFGQYNCINVFDGTTTINGGEFTTDDVDSTGEWESWDVLNEDAGTAAIKGGTFSKSVEWYLADGYCQVEGRNGYEVAAHIPGEAEEENRENATCTTAGSYQMATYCTRCDAELSRVDHEIPATGHTVEVIAGQAPDCTNDGYEEAYYCSVCQKYFATRVSEKELADEIADLAAWQITEAAEGNKATGGKIVALDHELKKTDEVPATCEEDGLKAYWTCQRNGCGAHFADEAKTQPIADLEAWKTTEGENGGFLKALEHTYESEVTKAPTCEATGVKTFTCKNDPTHTYTEDVDALDHNYTITYNWSTDLTACNAMAVCANDNLHQAGQRANTTLNVVTAATCEVDGAGVRVATFTNELFENQQKDVILPMLGHDYTSEVTTKPTCTAEGVETFTCKNDPTHTYTKPVDMIAHNMDHVAAVDATCTKGGNIEHYQCKACLGRFYDEAGQQPIEPGKHITDALNHQYNTVVTDPTCNDKGYTTYTCVRGDHTYVDNYVDALSHDYDEGVILEGNEPTCTEKGTKTFTCQRCQEGTAGHIKTEPVSATGHTGKEISGLAATCTTEGYKLHYVCENCGLYFTDEECTKLIGNDAALVTWKQGAGKYDAWKHNYVEVPGKAPDCTNPGYLKSYKCQRQNCGLHFADTNGTLIGTELDWGLWTRRVDGGYLEATGHTPGEKKTENVVAAKCDVDGSHDEVTYCTACTVETSRTTVIDPMYGHTEVPVEEKKPTCTASGLSAGVDCSVCGAHLEEQKFVPALGHTEETIPAVEATCTETGLTAGTKCSVCQLPLEPQEITSKKPHALVLISDTPKTCTEDGLQVYECKDCGYDTETVLTATGHTEVEIPAVDPTCTTSGATAGVKCSTCQEILTAPVEIEPNGHDYKEVATPSTCTVQGYTTYTCKVCAEGTEGHSYVGNYQPLAAHTEAVIPEVPATCTATGKSEGKYCSVCEKTLTEQKELPVAPHTPSIDAAKAPTCTEPGLTQGEHCSVCGKVTIEQVEDPATGHTGNLVKGVAAKCELAGWKDYYQCDGCKLFFEDEACQKPIADLTAWRTTGNGVIPGLEHVWDEGRVTTLPDCENDGVRTFTCKTCDGSKTGVEPALGHELVLHEAQLPTYYTPGWKAYETCNRAACEHNTMIAIEALGEPNVASYEEFMTSLKLLEGYANAYAKANPGKDPMWLLIKYVRTGVDRYNSGSWQIMAGYEDEAFADYVKAQEEAYNKSVSTVEDMINVTGIKNIKNFKLPNGQEVDFGHMFGTMDITYHNMNSINHADVSGWAGDLVDLLSTADRHDVTGTVDEMIKEIGTTYLNHHIEGEDDQFGQTDMYGDLDGYYFMNEIIGEDYVNGMLYGLMENYFTASLTDEQRADYFLKNRLGGVTGRAEIRDAVFTEYLGNSVIATLEGTREFKQSDISDLRKACCYAFADYLCYLAGDYVELGDNPYFTVNSTELSILAPGITQQIHKATTADGKNVVYYTATADVTSPYVNVYANYKDNDPSLGWGMQRVMDQANAAQAKYGDPNSEQYIENFNVIAAINGAGYNMSTGEPAGVLMMGGVEYQAPSGGFVGFLTDGSCYIGSDAEYYELKEKGLLRDAISQFGTTLVKDGKIAVTATSNYYTDRASRTAIGYTKTGKVVFMVMDGRQEPVSCGGSAVEIAQVMLEAGCVYAVNLDGGGSTTYVARQPGDDELSLVSSPSDGFQRSVSTSLYMASTAPSSTAFDHAVLDSEYRYLTIGATTQVTAAGVSATGNSVELPEGATWSVSDNAVLSITEDGLVTALANGKADVQLVVEGEVVGSRTINVVVPDAVYFTQENMNAVYEVPATLPVAALYEGKPVAIVEGDAYFTLSPETAGTTEGFTFTGIEESGVKTLKIYAHATNNPDATSGSMGINLFRADEASFDFENADGGDRLLAWHRVVSNSTTADGNTYTIVDNDQPMVTEYTFGMDMTQIPIPEKLSSLIYMLPGADVEGNNSAWDFLLQLAERISVLTNVTATIQLDSRFDVDISELSVNCEYFSLDKTELNTETNELKLFLHWKDQTKAIDPNTANPLVILAGIKLTPKADADWGAKDRITAINTGNVSYDIYMRANALYSFANKPENQEAFDIYPFVNNDVIVGGSPESGGHFSDVYKTFSDEYTLNKGLLSGWVYEDGGYAYYVDGIKCTGICKVGDYYYDFGTTGINMGQTKFTGMFQINGINHYSQNGLLTGGWYAKGEDKYYFDANGKAVNGELVLDEVKLVFENGLMVGGHTGFLAKSNGNTYYYENGNMVYGWMELDGKWYCFNDQNGAMTVGDGTNESKLFPTQEAKAKGAYYVFNEQGHALYSFPNFYGYYYWADQQAQNKWVRNGNDLDGWYRTNANAHFVTTSDASQLFELTIDGNTYTAVKIEVDGVVYTFDNSNGKLLLGSMVYENGQWFYYWAGSPVNNGWFQFEGETYYAYADGHLATGSATIDGENYMFTPQGMLITEGVMINAAISEDGKTLNVKVINADKDMTEARLAIWAEKAGQAPTLKWIDLEKTGDTTWETKVGMCQFQLTESDTFQLHVYTNLAEPEPTLVVDTSVADVAPVAHTYADDKDATCNICGFEREIVVEPEQPEKPVEVPTTPMYRLYNPNSGEHFYTGSVEEKDMLVDAGWNYEGIAWNAPIYTGAPVYRVYNPNSGDHHYTMSQDEVDMLVDLGWQYEGVAWNSAPVDHPEALPLYRLYNPNADCGSHHYTGSTEERDNLVSLGWHYEGIGWFGMLK